ncbi:hypothetical protein [Actinomadura rifamycini]|uniref:hypothetical protein n=1 Tax=Actinomadura rifamycini TaxID=31962 RepID=UPI00040937F4|nr:hypothetical protein [Actinomadura rifamycini]
MVDRPRSPARAWAAVPAVAVGIFALMTSELLPVGLLTPVGSDLDVLVAAFDLSIALGALIGGATIDRTATTGVLWVAGLLALLAAAAVGAAPRPRTY